ncbi:MAG: hypothetical protein KH328_01455 [Staphylococcus sp.]|nr:hypothetical protein [Staphylococcus sp.]
MSKETKCKDCSYCQSLGTTKIQRQGEKYQTGGRTKYYCMHQQAPMNSFIGYDMTLEIRTLKGNKSWCLIKYK